MEKLMPTVHLKCNLHNNFVFKWYRLLLQQLLSQKVVKI